MIEPAQRKILLDARDDKECGVELAAAFANQQTTLPVHDGIAFLDEGQCRDWWIPDEHIGESLARALQVAAPFLFPGTATVLGNQRRPSHQRRTPSLGGEQSARAVLNVVVVKSRWRSDAIVDGVHPPRGPDHVRAGVSLHG